MANSNPIQSHDLYQPGAQDTLAMLKKELVAIQDSMRALDAQARSLKKTLSSGVTSPQKVVAAATEADRIASAKKVLLLREQAQMQRIATQTAKQQAIAEQQVAAATSRANIVRQREIDLLNRQATATKKHSGSLTGMIGSIRNLAYAYFSLGAAAQVFQNILKQTKALDTLTVAFNTTLGSTQATAQAQEYLLDISERFGANLLGASQAYLKFSAASTQAGVSAQQTQDIFTSVTKASSILGLGAERTSYVFLALEQIMSKGRLSTEELRRQLGEHLPGAFGIAAEAMGVTTAKLTDMLKKGQIASTDFLPKFAKQLEKAYGIDQVERIDNLAAAQERFNNELTLLVKEGDLSEAFKEFFNTLAAGLRYVRENADAFLKLGEAIIYVAAAWAGWKIGAAVTAMGSLRKAMIALNAAMAANPAGVVIVAIVALVGAVDLLTNKINGATLAKKAYNDAQAEGASSTKLLEVQTRELIRAYKDENTSTEQKAKILKNLNALGIEAIDLDGDKVISTDEVTAAVKRQIAALQLRAQTSRLEREFDSIEAQQSELAGKKTFNDSGFSIASGIDAFFGTTITTVGKNRVLGELDIAKKEIEAKLRELYKAALEGGVGVGGETVPPTDPDGDPDAAFKKMIARRKKLNSFMEEGYDKDLDLLRIKLLEELHLNEDGLEGILEIEKQHLKRSEDLFNEYVLRRRKIRNDAALDGIDKDIEALNIWFDEQKLEYAKLNLDLAGLEQEKRDKLTDIRNKYIDEEDKALQDQFERQRDLADEKFRLAQEAFIAQLEGAGASDDTIGQFKLLQEIQLLKKRRDEHYKHVRYMTEDELKLNAAMISQKERQFSIGESDIAIEALKYTQKIERDTFNAQKHSASEKREFKKKQLLELYELELRLNQLLTKEQREAILAAKAELEGGGGVNENYTDIFDLLKIDFGGDEQKQAVIDALDFAKGQLTDFLDFQKEIIDQEIENADRKVAAAEENLSRQIALQNAGQANSVATAQAQLALEKKTQESALKQRQKIQKQELALNSILEASSLAVGIANTLKIGPAGIPLVAVMLGAFLAAKIKAFQLVNKKTFRKGGFEVIKGGSHESGNDTHVGGNNYAEKEESVGIFTAKATRKYKPTLKALVNAANKGTLENILIQDRRAIQGVNVVNKTDIDTSLMEKRLTRLVSLSEAKTFVDGRGRLVRIDRGRTTIINK